MENALNISDISKYWKSILETMPGGLMVVNLTGEIIMVNSALAKMMGYEVSELTGKSCRILGCNVCCKAREMGKGLYCALFHRKGIRKQRCVIIRKDGSELPIMKNADVLKNEDGNVIGGVEILTDLSETVYQETLISNLKKALDVRQGFEGFIGQSPGMQKIYDLLKSAAVSPAPVLVNGESGTGKELAASAVHNLSPRKDKPFIRVNCAALNESLLESELFGHVKGAFTGAEKNRAGRFEAAHSGSIFLDEIGDMPMSVQVKLLRVLQEKEVERVGDHRPIKVDVRIITATNRDLTERMRKGKFREDLYYRIGVIPVFLPPLRERREDIPLLTNAFMERIRLKTGKNIKAIGKSAMDALFNHHWPGNVRELMNALEHAFVLCPEADKHSRENESGRDQAGIIRPEHLPQTLFIQNHSNGSPDSFSNINASQTSPPPFAANIADNGYWAGPPSSQPNNGGNGKRARIIEALRQSKGNKSEAARLLGVSRVTLYNKIKKLDIRMEKEIR